MKSLFFSLLCISFAVAPTLISAQNNATVQVIQFEELEAALENDIQLLDVRTVGEFKAGHIKGALNIDAMQAEKLENYAQKLDKNKAVYMYCHSGGRSQQASQRLKNIGFAKIYDYSGGYSEWSMKSKK